MKRVEKMIKLFNEEVELHGKIGKPMPWMSNAAYRKNQDALKRRMQRNKAKQDELAKLMTYEEKERLYQETEINLND